MKYILSIIFTSFCLAITAQNLPERGELRKGNKAYEKEDYVSAAEHYSKSMAIAPDNFEARFNLAGALIKGEKMDEADKILTKLAADSLSGAIDRSESFYNLGNSQFAQEKLEEALESYKDAIRLNPNDMEAKYNYSYVKTLLEQQQQDQDQNEDDQENQDDQSEGDEGEQDQNQDQNEGDEGDDNQNEQEQPQNQDEQQQDQDEQESQPEPRDGEISEQELQQMLDAIQAQEDKTQEDLEEKARGVVIPGAKNW